MRSIIRFAVLTMALSPLPALAHVGHVAEVAGHGHWVAGAAIGLAVLVGLWGGRKRPQPEEDTADQEADSDEAEA